LIDVTSEEGTIRSKGRGFRLKIYITFLLLIGIICLLLLFEIFLSKQSEIASNLADNFNSTKSNGTHLQPEPDPTVNYPQELPKQSEQKSNQEEIFPTSKN
jgi:hypothetical protein